MIPTDYSGKKWEPYAQDAKSKLHTTTYEIGFPEENYLIGVRFLQKTTGLSNKIYEYYVNKETFEKINREINNWFSFCKSLPKDKDIEQTFCSIVEMCPVFDIGYSNPVIVTSIDTFPSISDSDKIKTLKKVNLSSLTKAYLTNKLYEVIKNIEFKVVHKVQEFQSKFCTKVTKFSILDCYKTSNQNQNEINKVNNFERKNNMFENIFKNVKFGKVDDNSIVMSIYGPAFVTSNGGYIAYNSDKNEYMDVEGLTFDFNNFCYQMPVAFKDVKKNDFILHNDNWARVIKVAEDGRLEVEKINQKEVVTILPTKNIFGFDFYTKLVTFGSELFGAGAASSDNPFGNMMLPMLMMNNDGNGSNDNFMNMWLLMNMQSQMTSNSDGVEESNGINSAFNFNNPMFLMMMLNK